VHRAKATATVADGAGGLVVVDVLGVVPFTADRGRMSVLLRYRAASGAATFLLYCKGADERVLPLCSGGAGTAAVELAVEALARGGLRTLVFAQRRLAAVDADAWLADMRAAATVDDAGVRRRRVAALHTELETQLVAIGTTGVEDQLQHAVPETIAKLRAANIRVWMLTGDKLLTAVQIARNSGLADRGDAAGVTLDAVDADALRRRLAAAPADATHAALNGAPPACFTVVVTGSALAVLLDGDADAALAAEFEAVVRRAATVVCCRVTPDQKAAVVRLVRRRGALCLAIGDGGNDVPMIQAAHVGVGLTGLEGRQAAQAADYAIARFHMLQPLLFAHGHSAVFRTSRVAQFNFSKSIVLGAGQLAYQAYARFSGVTYWDSMALTMYNGCYTAVLAFVPLLDIHLPRAVLLAEPALYRRAQAGAYMTWRTFAWAQLRSAAQLLAAFFVGVAAFNGDFVGPDGKHLLDGGTHHVPAFLAIVLVQAGVLLCEQHALTGLHAAAFAFTPASFILVYAFYAAVFARAPFYGRFAAVFGSAAFWLTVGLATGGVLMLYGAVAAVRFFCWPDRLQAWRLRGYLLRAAASTNGGDAGDGRHLPLMASAASTPRDAYLADGRRVERQRNGEQRRIDLDELMSADRSGS
jgi:magnesium-transporting ATPase (P-type)